MSVLGSIQIINICLPTSSSRPLRKPLLCSRCGFKSFVWFVLLNPLKTITHDIGIFIIPILWMRKTKAQSQFKVKWTSWHLSPYLSDNFSLLAFILYAFTCALSTHTHTHTLLEYRLPVFKVSINDPDPGNHSFAPEGSSYACSRAPGGCVTEDMEIFSISVALT